MSTPRADDAASLRSSLFTAGLIDPPVEIESCDSTDLDALSDGAHPPSHWHSSTARHYYCPAQDAAARPYILPYPLSSSTITKTMDASSLLFPSIAPQPKSQLNPTNSQGERKKKQALSCLFCRERKIACGRPEGKSDTAACRCVSCIFLLILGSFSFDTLLASSFRDSFFPFILCTSLPFLHNEY